MSFRRMFVIDIIINMKDIFHIPNHIIARQVFAFNVRFVMLMLIVHHPGISISKALKAFCEIKYVQSSYVGVLQIRKICRMNEIFCYLV